jgi:hypothetical protein
MLITRPLALVAALALLTPHLVASQVLDSYVGDTVRVASRMATGTPGRIAGRLVGFDARGVGVRIADDSVVWVPRGGLVSVSTGKTRTETASRQLVGILVGGVLGGVVGGMIRYHDDCATMDVVLFIPVCNEGTSDRSLEGTLIGFALGWAVGRRIKHERRVVTWSMVWKKAASGGGPADAIGLAFQVRTR